MDALMDELHTHRGMEPNTHDLTLRDTPQRMAILSDMRLFREGLACSFAHRHDIEVVENLAPVPGALMRIAESGATILLLDMAMPAAFAVLGEIACQAPGITVIVIAGNETDHELFICAKAGVRGYITRDSPLSDLIAAIDGTAHDGALYLPHIAALPTRRTASRSDSTSMMAPPTKLTRREYEIVTLLGENLSNKAIARRLKISAATVKNHVHNILGKLQVPGRRDAVAWLRNQTAWRRNRDFLRPPLYGASTALSSALPTKLGQPQTDKDVRNSG